MSRNKIFAVAFSVLVLTGCTADDEARRALKGAGYTDVQITGWRWLGCGKDDSFHTGFAATGPTGQPVTGVVCSGWLKGATVRID